jgi:thioredoxin-like negative regulator of GroEL
MKFSILTAGLLTVLGVNAASAVIDLIPDNFEKVVTKSGKPALVEFFAPWCGRKLCSFLLNLREVVHRDWDGLAANSMD